MLIRIQRTMNKDSADIFKKVRNCGPLKKAGRAVGQNVVEITIKMKRIVRKPLMIKTINECLKPVTICICKKS